jgi:cation transport regulator ChaC
MKQGPDTINTGAKLPQPDWVWYFAYGSNMNPARLFDERLGGDGVPYGARIAGALSDWALCFNVRSTRRRGAGYANITPQPGASTPGTLNAMPPEGLIVLDRYEGVASGHYQRRAVTVATETGLVPATTYIARRYLAEGLQPTEDYRAHLLAGADLLPAAHLAWLRALPCLPPG